MEIDFEKSYPLVQYVESTEENSMMYIRLCPNCGRFVKADDRSAPPFTGKPNATCPRCGRVEMPFYGWVADMMEV